MGNYPPPQKKIILQARLAKSPYCVHFIPYKDPTSEDNYEDKYLIMSLAKEKSK